MEKTQTRQLKRRENSRQGQALIEFTLTLPILVFLMFASYMAGAAMYTGANASSSVRTALQSQATYANSETPLADFESTVNAYNTGTFRIPGTTVDSVRLTQTTEPVAVIIAEKAVDFPLFPTLNFTITQGIKSNLMATNVGETGLGPAGTPYNAATPQTAQTILPANYSFQSDVPLYVPIALDCTPDLSVFDQATTVGGCDGACRAQATQDLFAAHIAPVNQLGGCTDTWHSPADVTFQ